MNYQVIVKRNDDTLARASILLRTMKGLGFLVEEYQVDDGEFYVSLADDKDMALSLVIQGIGKNRVLKALKRYIK